MTNPTTDVTGSNSGTNTSTPTTRLSALTNQLTPQSTTSTPPKMSTPETKPPITCHVLDTTIGRPAPSIPVHLTLHNPPRSLSTSPLQFSASTNSDGRVTSWTSSSPFSSASIEDVFKSPEGGNQTWSLRFDTEAYFGGRGIETFFPEVEVRFVVREQQRGVGGGKKEHFHVPVLLGPFGYTTYRGS